MGMRLTLQPRESLTVAFSVVGDDDFPRDARVSISAPAYGEVVEVHSSHPEELRMIAEAFLQAADELETR